MDEFGLDSRQLATEGYSFGGKHRRRIIHIPTGVFGEAEGEMWEQRSVDRRARAELAEKLGRSGGGTAAVPSRNPSGPRPGHLSALADEPPENE